MTSNKIYFYHDFKKISFVVWKRILQDLLSYHVIITDLEWSAEMEKQQKEIDVYLEHKGILPDIAKEQSLIDTINLLQDQINEIKQFDSLTSSVKKRIKALEEEVKQNQKELDFFNTYIKNNQFVYKKKIDEQQFFLKRKNALVFQKEMISNFVGHVNFSKKQLQRKLETISKRIKEQVPFDNFNLPNLYQYIKPYVDIILTTPDNGYDFLQKNLYLDY